MVVGVIVEIVVLVGPEWPIVAEYGLGNSALGPLPVAWWGSY